MTIAIYRGATVITPNRKELAEHTRVVRSATPRKSPRPPPILRRRSTAEAVLVTRSEDGMFLHVGKGAEPVHMPAYPVKVRDVSGAGDTVVATLSVMLAGGSDFEAAMRAANAAAAVVVGKSGTAAVTPAELRVARCCRRRRLHRKKRSHSTGASLTTAHREWRGARPAHRLYQRLLRPAASGPREGAGEGARRL